jgi:uncharacterized protein
MARQLGFILASVLTASSALAHDDTRPRILTVGGTGEVSVVPDRADVGLAVEASERSLEEAEKGVTEAVARVLKVCDELGIPRNLVGSAQLMVQPQYETGKIISGRPKIVGYIVSRQLSVDLRDLSRLGRLLQGAVDAGANQVSGPSFGSSRKDEHQRAALAKAAEDAQANARELAKTLGVKLGRLHSLSASEAGGEPPREMYATRMKAMVGQESAAASYEPGEIKFHASVTAEYDLP